MKNRIITVSLMAVSLCVVFFPRVWAADELKGYVQAIGFSTVDIIEQGHWTNERVKVDGDTAYQGVGGIKELKAGDEVAVAYRVENGSKIAASITKSEPEPKANPQSLPDKSTSNAPY